MDIFFTAYFYVPFCGRGFHLMATYHSYTQFAKLITLDLCYVESCWMFIAAIKGSEIWCQESAKSPLRSNKGRLHIKLYSFVLFGR